MTKQSFYKIFSFSFCLGVGAAVAYSQPNWGMPRVANLGTPLGEKTQRINNTPKQTVAPTPPMGWNSWNDFGLEITESEFKTQVDYVATHLKQFGYEYVIIDAAWYSSHVSAVKQSKYHHAKYANHDANVDAYGRLIPAPNKFPNANGSLKYLADYVHAKGLKLGIHVQRGIPWQAVEKDLPIAGSTYKAKDIANPADLCIWYNAMYGVDMTKNGAQEYYNSIFALYASWGIDFVKVDDLVMPYHADEVTAIRKAMERTKRKMVFSGSPGSTPTTVRYHVLNNTDMFRVSSDFWDTWPQLQKQFEYAKQWAVYSVNFPGHWPDLDMLPVGKIGTRSGDAGGERITRFTKEEQYTLMTLWCISRSPLIVSNDLTQNDDFTLQLLTNTEVLDVNKSGSKQHQFYDENGIIGWHSINEKNGSHYIALFNHNEKEAKLDLPLSAVEIKGEYIVRDLWKRKEVGSITNNIAVTVPAHGVVLYQLKQQPVSTMLQVQPVDPVRVNEIAAMLPQQPAGFGDPIEKRVHWDSLLATGKFTALIVQADSIAVKPFPRLTEDLYMTYYGGKDSETSKRFIMKRRMLLTRMVWAECLTNKGKYIPAIIAALDDIVNTPSWAFPAEDREKTNWEGKLYTINLSSSAYGSDIAQSLYLLNSKLPATLKQRMKSALQQKLFNPVLDAVNNRNNPMQFIALTDLGNHNPVTLANVLGAAFAVLEDKNQRATFAAIAEKYSNNYLLSFLDDGYCTEGMNYYGYGFGHYLFLRELLTQATKGQIDIFQRPKIEKITRFAPAMEIINGVYPAISDCEQDLRPDPQLMHYLNKAYALGLPAYNQLPAYINQPALCYLMYFFPNAASAAANKTATAKGLAIRDYFDKAGVLTVRPRPGTSMNIGATFKGGNNAEQHNHNDLGSYTIVVGDELLTGDVGLATYTPKYFGKERYDLFKTTASYGHNVPLINGVQQHFGADAQAEIITSDFSDDKDSFSMDLSSAYKVGSLQQLRRTFIYNRKNGNNIIIEDSFAFAQKAAFETALITRFPWKKLEQHPANEAADTVVLEITGKKSRLLVHITGAVKGLTISDEVINEAPQPFTRIALKLPPIKEGNIKMKFEEERLN